MKDISNRFGIYDRPLDLDKLPYTPSLFSISRFGGILDKSTTKWFGFPSKNSIQTVCTRHYGFYSTPLKCILHLVQDGEVVFNYIQDRAIQEFDFTSSGKSILEVYVQPSKIQNRRMILTIQSIAKQYQQFFKANDSSKTLYFDLYIPQNNAFVRRQTYGVSSFESALADVQRNYKAYEFNKLHTSAPRFKVISKEAFMEPKKLKKRFENIDIEDANYMLDDQGYFTKDIPINTHPVEQRVGTVLSSLETACLVDTFNYGDDVIQRCMDVDRSNRVFSRYYILNRDKELQQKIESMFPCTCVVVDKCIKQLYTVPEYRNNGYAKTLLKFLFSTPSICDAKIIRAEPFGDKSMTAEDLKSLYKSLALSCGRSDIQVI